MKRNLMALCLGALAGASLPSVVYGHSYLLSPVPRAPMTVHQGNAPCGGEPRGTSPTVLTPGQSLQVMFAEVQDHGNFEVRFSAANDQNFVLLADVPNPPSGTNSVMVTLPDTPCQDCTLQLVQHSGSNPNNFYYSCADVRLGVAGPTTTTTTTTEPGASTTTTTTTAAAGCAALEGFDQVNCLLNEAQSAPPCDGLDPALARNLAATLRATSNIVARAQAAGSPGAVRRLLLKADRRLKKLGAKTSRFGRAGRVDATCEGSMQELVSELRAALAALLPA